MKKQLLFLFIIFLSLPVCGQQRIGNFIAYSRENGLGQHTFSTVFESSDGYLWIGSNSGLFRFDGKRFQQISSLYYNSNSPGDNSIVDFAEDNLGNLWIAGFRYGITKYNLKTGRFRQYKRLSADSTETYGTPCIYKDNQGTLWMGTAGRGLAKYLSQKDTFQLFYPDPLKATDGSIRAENNVTGITEDNNDKNILWLSCLDGLYSFNKKTNAFIFHPFYYTGNKIKNVNYFLCIEQWGNYLYLGTWYEGLILFDKITNQFKRIPYNNPGRNEFHYGIMDLQLLGDSVIYMACINDGLLRYHVKTHTISAALTQPDVKQLNTEIGIQRVSLTKHAGIFAGGNAAIYQLHPNNNRFTHQINYPAEKTFPEEDIHLNASVYDANKKGYWNAYFNYNGLVFIDSSFSTMQLFPAAISNKNIFIDVAKDADNNVWGLDRKGLLYFVDIQNKITQPANTLPGGILLSAENKLLQIETDATGNLWLAGKKEVYHYNLRNKQLSTFTIPLQQFLKHSKNGIKSLVVVTDSKNNAWAATNAGLFKFDITTKKVNYFFDSVNTRQPLASNNIKSITVDNQDNVWLGYYSEGIQVLNTDNLTIAKRFTTENGLPAMEINFLACDRKNNILACLNNGLAIYTPTINNWQIINGRDGLKKDYLDVPVFASSNGQIIVDQVNSGLVFNLDSLWGKKDSTFTHITSLKINGSDYRATTLPNYISSIELPSGTKDIHIEFSATNWQLPFSTKYFYRVDGIHKSGDWIAVHEAMINLTGLSSGKYTFRFYAVTADGVKTGDRTLEIKINPPFYKTWWFIVLCLLALSGILYGIYKYRINQLKKVQYMRNSISRDLHDDVGATMTSISILSEVASQKVQQQQTAAAHQMMNQIGVSSRLLLQNLDDIIWSINPKNDSIEKIVLRIKELATEVMELNKITYHLHFDNKFNNIGIPMQNRRHLFLIFKEALNNMVKYSHCKNAILSMYIKENTLILALEDDGIGFDTNNFIAGNGLSNMQQRATEMKGKLLVQSTPGKGTSITLRCPL
ncbi:MAG: histidine kinase [Bacteroidota bacterium]|nr:histidine kinase [Bacteroidota bacterium]